MKINQLKTGMNNVNVTGKVTSVSEPRQVKTKFGTQTTLTTATLEDETGKIKLVMWGMQSDGILDEVVVEIKNGFVNDFKGELQLGIGKGGSISVIG